MSPRAASRFLAAVVSLSSLAGCDGAGPSPEPAPVAGVTIAPTEPALAAGATLQLTATPLDADNQPLSGRTVTWSTASPEIATVSDGGVVTGVAQGAAAITATVESHSAQVTATVGPAGVASISISPPVQAVFPGQQSQLTATTRDNAGNILTDREITWSSSDPNVAEVSATGLVTGVNAGKVSITATSESKLAIALIDIVEGGVVGAGGGTVSAFAGTVVLTVPPGALAADVGITMVRAAGPLDATTAAGTAFEFRPAGLTFAIPADLTLTYDPAKAPDGVAEDQLGVRRLTGRSWSALPGGSNEPAAHRTSAAIEVAGTYGVGRRQPATPCTAAPFREFDFWLGSWDVAPTGSPPNARQARSEITAEPGGCAIFEDFTDLNNHGVSISVFNPDTENWHQTFIDNVGAEIRLAGTLVGGNMVLTDAGSTQRFTWEPLGGGQVRQVGETSTDGGATWVPLFDLTYRPR